MLNNVVYAIVVIFIIIKIVYTLYQIIHKNKKEPQDPIKRKFLQVWLYNYINMLIIIILLWIVNNQTTQIAGIYDILDGMNGNLTKFASNLTDFASNLTDLSKKFTKFLKFYYENNV